MHVEKKEKVQKWVLRPSIMKLNLCRVTLLSKDGEKYQLSDCLMVCVQSSMCQCSISFKTIFAELCNGDNLKANKIVWL